MYTSTSTVYASIRFVMYEYSMSLVSLIDTGSDGWMQGGDRGSYIVVMMMDVGWVNRVNEKCVRDIC